MNWFSSKSKQERKNDSYAEGQKAHCDSSPVSRLAYSFSLPMTNEKSSAEVSFREGYSESERREYAGHHSKK